MSVPLCRKQQCDGESFTYTKDFHKTRIYKYLHLYTYHSVTWRLNLITVCTWLPVKWYIEVNVHSHILCDPVGYYDRFFNEIASYFFPTQYFTVIAELQNIEFRTVFTRLSRKKGMFYECMNYSLRTLQPKLLVGFQFNTLQPEQSKQWKLPRVQDFKRCSSKKGYTNTKKMVENI